MVKPTVGAVVLISFPLSDLSATRLRSALVVASSSRGDWICAQITSNPYSDPLAIELSDKNFQVGSLNKVSYVKSAKLFTANESLFRSSVGELREMERNSYPIKIN